MNAFSHLPNFDTFSVDETIRDYAYPGQVEGIVDHHLLGLHHVNERVPPDQWMYWDLGFLVWGALMLAGGWLLWQAGKRETATRQAAVQ